jgi:hypothetical protein
MKFKKTFLILLLVSTLFCAELPFVDEDQLNYKYEINSNKAQWSTRLRLITTKYGNFNFIYYMVFNIDPYTLDTKDTDKKILSYNYKF